MWQQAVVLLKQKKITSKSKVGESWKYDLAIGSGWQFDQQVPFQKSFRHLDLRKLVGPLVRHPLDCLPKVSASLLWWWWSMVCGVLWWMGHVCLFFKDIQKEYLCFFIIMLLSYSEALNLLFVSPISLTLYECMQMNVKTRWLLWLKSSLISYHLKFTHKIW